MSVTSKFLNDMGVELSEREFIDLLRPVVLDARAPSRAPLSGSAADYLSRNGGVTPDPGSVARVGLRTTQDWVRIVSTSHTPAQVARMLGRDPSRVRHLIADSGLYAIAVGRNRLLPQWQFEDGRPLPGLREVLAALPATLHPLEVEGWMTSPSAELELRETPVPPRVWLAAGGDVQAAVALARDLDTQ